MSRETQRERVRLFFRTLPIMGVLRIFSRGGKIRGRDESPPVGFRDEFTVGQAPKADAWL